MSDRYKYADLSINEYKKRYAHEPFIFRHSLKNNSLLSLQKLQNLILRMPDQNVFFSSGDVSITDNLDQAHKDHKPKVSLKDALNNLESAGAFVMVRGPEIDSEYRELFNDLLNDVKIFTRDIDPGLAGAMLYLFIGSPQSITPFHIDRYATLLFQIKGHKDVHVWKPWNKDLVSDMELERFFAREEGFSPTIKDGFLDKSIVNHLHEGEGVHIPFIAPHFVQNSNEVSISLSIIFNSRLTCRLSDALTFNYLFRRKMARIPSPVNENSVRDRIKSLTLASYKRIKNISK